MSDNKYRVANLNLFPGFTNSDLKAKAAQALGVSADQIQDLSILREAVDARKKSSVHYVVTCTCTLVPGAVPTGKMELYETKTYEFPFRDMHAKKEPVVVGSGPAGIFCALSLARTGLKPILIEQGTCVEKRIRDVDTFFATGELNPLSNVQFGEGGAGTFSDGKLTTGTRDPRQRYVIDTYIAAGAPPDIAYLAKPHVGTDKLRAVTRNMRAELERLGGTVLFGTTLIGLEIKGGAVAAAVVASEEGTRRLETDHVVIAPGNGARATFEMLYEAGVEMRPKNFAVGVRIEQLQKNIDIAQYGTMADFKNLPAADYKVTYHAKTGRPVYSFCVCPGGEVVAAASGCDEVVTNGMSFYARDGANCNGALIVGVTPEDFPGDSPLSGIVFQKQIEAAAFLYGGGGFTAPIQLAGDFLKDRPSRSLGEVMPTYRPEVRFANLRKVLPDYVWESLAEALPEFGRRIRGFDAPDAVLTAAETRTSSPVCIVRGDNGMASVRGLFPCGEGAGYAGGIMSAATDGLRCAEHVCEDLS